VRDVGPLIGLALLLGCGSSAAPKDGGVIAVDASTGDAALADAAPADAPPVVLCDGVAHLRLWALGEAGREVGGSTVRTELGYPFVVVDGTCTYWVGGGSSEDPLGRDLPLRTGMLTQVEAGMLERAIPLDGVAALDDCHPVPGSFDVGVRSIRAASGVARCESSGAVFDAAWSTLDAAAEQLRTRGTPMTGAIHVAALASDGAPTLTPYAWPLTEPLSSFIVTVAPDGSGRAGSHLVSDADAAAKLRALRDRYLIDRAASPGLFVNWDGLQATDQATTATVFMRDAIPYEDALPQLGVTPP
jgi:hypothetical protein